MTSSFFLNLLRQGVEHNRQWFQVGSPGLLDFGQFTVSLIYFVDGLIHVFATLSLLVTDIKTDYRAVL